MAFTPAGYVTGNPETRTVVLDSDLDGKQYTFVDFDGTDENVVNATADAATQMFVLLNAADGSTTATEGSVAVGGSARITLGGTVAQGDYLTATTAGVAIKTTTDGDYYGAVALQSGVTGDVVPCRVVQGTVSNPA